MLCQRSRGEPCYCVILNCPFLSPFEEEWGKSVGEVSVGGDWGTIKRSGGLYHIKDSDRIGPMFSLLLGFCQFSKVRFQFGGSKEVPELVRLAVSCFLDNVLDFLH